jgi:hypothetical protein
MASFTIYQKTLSEVNDPGFFTLLFPAELFDDGVGRACFTSAFDLQMNVERIRGPINSGEFRTLATLSTGLGIATAPVEAKVYLVEEEQLVGAMAVGDGNAVAASRLYLGAHQQTARHVSRQSSQDLKNPFTSFQRM